MRRTLLLKLILAYLAILVLGFFIISTVTTQKNYQQMQIKEAEGLYREAKLLATTYTDNYYNNSISLDEFQQQISALGLYLNASIWIINPQGEILVHSDNFVANQDSMPDFSIKSFGTHQYQLGTLNDFLPEESVIVYSPLNKDYTVQGYVLLSKYNSILVRNADGFVNISYLSLALVGSLTLLFFLFVLFTIYFPIKKIVKGSRAYAAGNYGQKIKILPTDELSYVSDTLNYMASELDTLEDDQRKFISNVSHDFRSPLTSIKGYIEAILDGTIPQELQGKYLNIILTETARLTKLTQSMLELNKYGTHGAILDITSFDINNIIRMTAQSFEGTCIGKRISFELILTGKELFVTADMSKIQQVLYNLIDNAIKFSNPDSSIVAETTVRNDKVFVSIKDSGIGIPKDSLKKIWDRFYKSDLSRGKDKKGTGLGLAIVKEIIQSHNENINVISTEGVGTEFIFTLSLTHTE